MILENVHLALLGTNTKAAPLKWYEFCEQKNNNILVYETIRTSEKLRDYVAFGASQNMKSYHLVGQALYFVPVECKGKTI
jgi:peptidoglycan L-alanyl-D-glutamate endopeptidase CwlK